MSYLTFRVRDSRHWTTRLAEDSPVFVQTSLVAVVLSAHYLWIRKLGFDELLEFYINYIWSVELWREKTLLMIIALPMVSLLAILVVFLIYVIIRSIFSHFRTLFTRARRASLPAHILFVTYIEALFAFALVYFLLNVHGDQVHIQGLQSLSDRDHYDDFSAPFVFTKLLVVYFDCIHFSIVTQTTLGYGDMLPATILGKVLVDLQVLLGLYFIAVAIGRGLSKDENTG